MTKSETAQLFAGLRRSYPRFHVDPAALDEYHRHLEPYPHDIVQQAADDHVQHSPLFPVIAELLERIRSIQRQRGTQTSLLDEPDTRLSPAEYRHVRQQISTVLRSVDEGPPGDAELVEAARRCHAAWLEAVGPEDAAKRVRQHYPDHADTILQEQA
jgi:hypothetical protein